MGKYYLFLIAFSVWIQPVHAQVSSHLGRFVVNYDRGCSGLQVQVRNISGTVNPSFSYEAANPVSEDFTGDSTYTYNNPGVYTITMVTQALTPSTDTLRIRVFDAVTPTFDIDLCNSNGFIYTPVDGYYDYYEVNVSDGAPSFRVESNEIYAYRINTAPGSFTISSQGFFENAAQNCPSNSDSIITVGQLQTPLIEQLAVQNDSVIQLDHQLAENTSYLLFRQDNGNNSFRETLSLENNEDNSLIDLVDTRENYACFYIGAYDGCQDSLYASDTICSIALSATITPSAHTLRWASGSDETLFLLKNNEVIIAANSLRGTIQDEDIACNRDERYYAYYFTDRGGRSITDTTTLTGRNSSSGSLQLFNTRFVGQSLLVNWSLRDAAIESYTLRAAVNNSTQRIVQQSLDTVYRDTIPRVPENSYCFSLMFQDSCGNRSTNYGPVCPSILTGRTKSQTSVLSWTPYRGYEDGPYRYVLTRSNNAGERVFLDTLEFESELKYTDAYNNLSSLLTTYTVIVINNRNEFISSSNSYTYVSDPVVTFATAFSPNNDGINDKWRFKGSFLMTASVSIYNRWGNIVAKMEGLDMEWDGTDITGEELPSGNYVYVCKVFDQLNRSFDYRGGIVLIR